jgi:hypothetical protein
LKYCLTLSFMVAIFLPRSGSILGLSKDLDPAPVSVLQAEHTDHPRRRDRLLHRIHVRGPAARVLADMLAPVRPPGVQEHASLVRVVRAPDRHDPGLRQLLQVGLAAGRSGGQRSKVERDNAVSC